MRMIRADRTKIEERYDVMQLLEKSGAAVGRLVSAGVLAARSGSTGFAGWPTLSKQSKLAQRATQMLVTLG